ncbi:MAG: ParB/RepB/Spo0J family partition protein [Peptostreptococcaceae bacterium]
MNNIDFKNTRVEFVEPKKIERKYSKEMFGSERWIPMSQIKIDMDVQRTLDAKHAKNIAKKFDPASFGRVTVNQREDGLFYAINGQHRMDALKELGFTECPCIVINCIDKKDEGQSFIKINENAKAVSTIDKYRIGVSAEVSEWLKVKAVLDFAGITRVSGNPNSFRSVGTIYKEINQGSSERNREENTTVCKIALKVLKNTCQTLGEMDYITVSGMITFCRAYALDGTVSMADMESRFKDISYIKLTREAKNMKKQSGGNCKVINYMAFLLHTEYNKNIAKSKKLPLRIDIY